MRTRSSLFIWITTVCGLMFLQKHIGIYCIYLFVHLIDSIHINEVSPWWMSNEYIWITAVSLRMVILEKIACYTRKALYFNTLRPRQYGHNSPDGIFKCFLSKNVWISINISLKFVPCGPIPIFQHWFGWWLGADQVIIHYLNQWWLVYWRIHPSLSLNGLRRWYPTLGILT